MIVLEPSNTGSKFLDGNILSPLVYLLYLGLYLGDPGNTLVARAAAVEHFLLSGP
jgi:hypothetical protein